MVDPSLVQDPLTGWQIGSALFAVIVFILVTVFYFKGPPDPPFYAEEEDWA